MPVDFACQCFELVTNELAPHERTKARAGGLLVKVKIGPVTEGGGSILPSVYTTPSLV